MKGDRMVKFMVNNIGDFIILTTEIEVKPFGSTAVQAQDRAQQNQAPLPPRHITASDILAQRTHSPATPPPGGMFPGLKDIWDQVNEKQRQDEAPAILSDDEAAHALLGAECTDVERKVRLLKKAGFCICKEKSDVSK